jgi:hypothetical protein
MPSTDAALRMNSAQSAGCVVFTLTVGLFIDLDSKGGSVVVEASTVIELLFVSRVSSVRPPKMVIAVRYNPASPVEVRWVALVFSRQPSIPMRLEFRRIRKRSIRRGLLDLADDGASMKVLVVDCLNEIV